MGTRSRGSLMASVILQEACWEGVSVRHRLDAGRMAVKAGKTGVHTHQER